MLQRIGADVIVEVARACTTKAQIWSRTLQRRIPTRCHRAFAAPCHLFATHANAFQKKGTKPMSSLLYIACGCFWLRFLFGTNFLIIVLLAGAVVGCFFCRKGAWWIGKFVHVCTCLYKVAKSRITIQLHDSWRALCELPSPSQAWRAWRPELATASLQRIAYRRLRRISRPCCDSMWFDLSCMFSRKIAACQEFPC